MMIYGKLVASSLARGNSIGGFPSTGHLIEGRARSVAMQIVNWRKRMRFMLCPTEETRRPAILIHQGAQSKAAPLSLDSLKSLAGWKCVVGGGGSQLILPSWKVNLAGLYS